jgi:hypothetical protein
MRERQIGMFLRRVLCQPKQRFIPYGRSVRRESATEILVSLEIIDAHRIDNLSKAFSRRDGNPSI